MSSRRYRSVQLDYQRRHHKPLSTTRAVMFAAVTITALLLAALVGGLFLAMKGLQ